MKDSSRLIPVYPDYVKYIQFNFLRNNFEINYYPVQNHKSDTQSYHIKDNSIFVSDNLSYEIEKITQDSLIIVEKMSWLEDDKLKRFYLMKEENIFEEESLRNKNSLHLIANPYYTPTFKGNLPLLLNKSLNKKHRNQKLKGVINIFPEEKKVRVDINYRSSKDSKQEGIITKYLEQSFKKLGYTRLSTICYHKPKICYYH